MRALVLALFVFAASPADAQQKHELPHDGNGLLEYCSAMVTLADTPATITSLGNDAFNAEMMKLAWCSGYLQAVNDAALSTKMNIYLLSKAGVTLEGPDNKIKEYAFNTLRGVCIPDKVPLLQLARVVVKWLREHPEKLQMSVNDSVTDAINDAFPCTPVAAQEPAKPQDGKSAVAKPKP
jgi:hypothetical protein